MRCHVLVCDDEQVVLNMSDRWEEEVDRYASYLHFVRIIVKRYDEFTI